MGFWKRPFGNPEFGHRLPRNEMFLNDPFENRGGTSLVPGPFWIDDCNGAIYAHAQAVRFRPEYLAAFAQTEFFQTRFEIRPGFEAGFLVATLWFGLIAAKEDVALDRTDLEIVDELLGWLIHGDLSRFRTGVGLDVNRLTVRGSSNIKLAVTR